MEPENSPDMPVVAGIEEPNEKYEEAIAQMRQWLSKIYSASKVDRALHIELAYTPDSVEQELRLRAKIWTSNNVYTIVAHLSHCLSCTEEEPLHTYLGCTVCGRKARTGETWNRGNDLADGKFSEETWQKILQDIVRYEAEEVKSERWKN